MIVYVYISLSTLVRSSTYCFAWDRSASNNVFVNFSSILFTFVASAAGRTVDGAFYSIYYYRYCMYCLGNEIIHVLLLLEASIKKEKIFQR